MNVALRLRQTFMDFLVAVQFLTRVPVPVLPYEPGSLARSVAFFPVVGFTIGLSGAFFSYLIAPHLPRVVTSLLVVIFLIVITGGLHEDGFADVADAFGGGNSREKILLILRDSRIGSYGGVALVVSLLSRTLLISSLPLQDVSNYLVVACTLCRWTPLPLSYFLPSARNDTSSVVDGQGARIARLISPGALVTGTAFSVIIAAFLLRERAIAPLLTTITISGLTAIYYNRRILGITGDCFGATIQLTEIGVYLCGVWVP